MLSAEGDNMDRNVSQLIMYLNANYRHKIAPRQMAALVNLSESRITHLFTRETGLPPSAFLKRLRMDEAARLLRSTSLSIKEIMFCVGFSDPSHFVKDFAGLYGDAPSAYRVRRKGFLARPSSRSRIGQQTAEMATHSILTGKASPTL